MKRKKFTLLILSFFFFAFSGLLKAEETERYYIIHNTAGLAMGVSNDVARLQNPQVGDLAQQFELRLAGISDTMNIISEQNGSFYYRSPSNNWTTNFVTPVNVLVENRAKWKFTSVGDGIYTIRATVNIETHFLGPNNPNLNEILYADKAATNQWRLVKVSDSEQIPVALAEVEAAIGDVSVATSPLNLITETTNGGTVSWSSTHPTVIDPVTGVITSDPDHNRDVVLTATVSLNGFVSHLKYEITVNTDNPVDPLVVHYTFNDELTEGGGAIADATGNDYNGVATGVEIIDIAGQKVLDLGDANGFVAMNTLGGLIETLNDYTVSVNVFVAQETNLSAAGSMFWSFGNSDNAATDRNGYMFFSARATGWTITETYWANDQGVGVNSNIAKGKWMNVVATLNGNIGNVYVDGELVASKVITLKPSDLGNTAHNFLGKPVFQADAFMKNTLLNDFRIYNKALNASEIAPLTGNIEALNAAMKASLSELSLSAGSLSPAFDPDVKEYTASVPFGTTSVNVTAVSDLAEGEVNSDGAIEIVDGVATAEVVVTYPIPYVSPVTYTIQITEAEYDYSDMLKVHYTFDAGTYNDTEKTVADVSGSNFVGKVMNVATVEEFNGISVLNLGNSNGYFDLSAQVGADVISTLEDFTISTVVYVPAATNIDGNGRFLWGFGNSNVVATDRNGLAYYRLTNSQYTITPQSWQDGQQRNVIANVAPPRDSWQRLTVVQENMNVKIYLNDALIADNSEAIDMTMSALGSTTHNYIGFPHYSPNDNYLQNVYVADFRLYNTALSEDFIKAFSNPAEIDVAKAELEAALGDLSNVVANLTLLAEASNGVKIEWKSSHPEVIDPATGEVIPDANHNKEVTLKAIVTFGTVSKIFDYVAVVTTENPINPLAVHYTFEDVLTEENDVIADVSGNDFNGVAHNVSIVDIAGFKALDLGAANGYVHMNTLGSLVENLGDFTISFNIFIANATNLGVNGNMVWAIANSDNAGTDANGYMFFGARRTIYSISPTHWQGEQATSANKQLTKGEWLNVVTSLNGDATSIYINGELVASGNVTMKPSDLGNTIHNYIGKPSYAGDAYLLNSLISDFRIYSKALNAEERAPLTENIEALNAAMEISLTELSTDLGDLNPAFDSEIMAYTVLLPAATETVNVIAVPSVVGAGITGDGAITIVEGVATATITVVSPYPYAATEIYTIEFSLDPGSSIRNAKAAIAEVFPTISSDRFNVKFIGEPGIITVYNIAGAVISKIKATSDVETITVSEAGVYLLHIESQGQVTVVKVVKTK